MGPCSSPLPSQPCFSVGVWWEGGYQESQRPFRELADLFDETGWGASGVPSGFPATLAPRTDYSCAAQDPHCYGVSVTALVDCPNGVQVILAATAADGHTEAALRGTTSAMEAGESRVVVAPSPQPYPRIEIWGAGCVRE